MVPAIRIAQLNDRSVCPEGGYVLYWMTSARRACWNFALDRAIERAMELRRPVVVLETLVCQWPWMNSRHAAMVLAGMADNAAAFQAGRIHYVPCVAADSARLQRIVGRVAQGASVAVTDWYPLRECAELASAVAARCPVRIEQVDSNGLAPLASTERAYPSAHAFRRFLQRCLPEHLLNLPCDRPKLPNRFPRADGLDIQTAKDCAMGVENVGRKGPALAAKYSTCPGVQPVAGAGRESGSWQSFSTGDCLATPASATCRKATPPAGCRPTFTTGRSRPTRCLPNWRACRSGHRTALPTVRRGAGKGGGAWTRRRKHSSTS